MWKERCRIGGRLGGSSRTEAIWVFDEASVRCLGYRHTHLDIPPPPISLVRRVSLLRIHIPQHRFLLLRLRYFPPRIRLGYRQTQPQTNEIYKPLCKEADAHKGDEQREEGDEKAEGDGIASEVIWVAVVRCGSRVSGGCGGGRVRVRGGGGGGCCLNCHDGCETDSWRR